VIDATLPPGTVAAGAETPAQAATVTSSKAFNPDISVNGNFVGAAGSNPFATFPALQLNEVEAAFRAIVDPYARADFYFAAGPEGVEVEEGIITPRGCFQGRQAAGPVWKMKRALRPAPTGRWHGQPLVETRHLRWRRRCRTS
jgi:hypothetical protein